MKTDIAALVFIGAAAAGIAEAEKSRVFARGSFVGKPKHAPLMPDKCPIIARVGAILDLIQPQFALGGA